MIPTSHLFEYLKRSELAWVKSLGKSTSQKGLGVASAFKVAADRLDKSPLRNARTERATRAMRVGRQNLLNRYGVRELGGLANVGSGRSKK
jgi:hypothetical protein